MVTAVKPAMRLEKNRLLRSGIFYEAPLPFGGDEATLSLT